jgi:hypothetical protein
MVAPMTNALWPQDSGCSTICSSTNAYTLAELLQHPKHLQGLNHPCAVVVANGRCVQQRVLVIH